MTDDTKLASRAVACDGWRWMPGMLIRNADGPVRIDAVDGTQPGVLRKCRFTNSVYVADVRSGPLPDLTDPATLGCVLALVREAWGDPLICTAVDNTGAGWWVDGWADKRPDSDLHNTEAAALVAALEAAPVGCAS